MKKTKWDLKKGNVIKTNLSVDKDILSILAARNITKKEDIVNFLQPKLENLEDPKLLYDMTKARDRVKKAIENNERICIYGDYDVDGITATSILYLGLQELGATNITYYIPIRDEGYGLNMEALESIKKDNVDLVITVDCGITSYKEIEYANKLGLTTIITDHHTLLNPIVPNAFAVVNPKRLENKYSFNDLAGVGTAFMLLISLFEIYDKREDAFKYIDIVSLGTVADVVSLINQNRIIVKFGLERLANTTNLGLKMLCDKLFDSEKDEYTTADIGFAISPVFNAAGRLQDAKLAVKLLTSQNEREISVIINELLSKNSQRKQIQNDIFELAKKELEDIDDFILISSSPTYHHGVIGIVAAKIVDMYYKPSIILEEKTNEGIAVASCRSISNFDITKALQYCSDLLVKYGGHKGAAGFTIKIENIPEFKKKINEYARKNLKEDDFCKVISIDKSISINKMSYEFYKTLELLKPFGFGNPTPVFLTKNVIIENQRLIGEKKNHLSFDISQKGYTNRGAVWFFNDELKDKTFYDIVYKINLNKYKGRFYTKIYIEDMKESLLKDDKFEYLNSLYGTSYPMKSIFYTNKEINLDDELTLELKAQRVLIYKNREYVSKLDDNIARVLIQSNKFYNYQYNIKVEKVKNSEDINSVEILIKRDYSFTSYKKNDVNIFNKIKKMLIGVREYNSIEKKALSILFKDDKNLLLSSQNITGDINIKNEHYHLLFKTFAIYETNKSNEKIFTNLNISDKLIKNYISTKYDNQKFAIIDKTNIKKEIDLSRFEKVILIDNNIKEKENFVSLEHNITIPENVLKLTKTNIEKYGYDNVYIKSLPNQIKVKLKEELENGENILSDDSILEIL
ncbi:single-stranded-DNA-specific exonuclease RecJ [Oceanivirga salmonicida]|uniref:single-stranded-DNA-specific exonuclease RecJ n=1 Tax=Oceanivirga salmonicida TaxID=1769291 RepID=UPI00082B117F|nr:single-stranded-DNA-specific exonuclease RecJ [Oceanivirga salmonicida]